MKRIMLGFLLGITLCSVVVYGATTLYQVNTVFYQPSDASWEVNNVNEAINSLYDDINSLPEPTKEPVVINGVAQSVSNNGGTQNITVPSGGTTLYLVSTISGLWSNEAPYISSTNNIVNSEIVQDTRSGLADYFAAGYKVIKYTLDTTEEIVVTFTISSFASKGMNCYTLIRI